MVMIDALPGRQPNIVFLIRLKWMRMAKSLMQNSRPLDVDQRLLPAH